MTTSNSMVHPNPEMLLYIGMADAYAAAVEYLKGHSRDHSMVREALKFERYLQHPTHGHTPGFYTDDTEMSVANAHVLLSDHPMSERMFVWLWLREFVRGGKRKGYARAFQQFLEECVADCRMDARVTRDHVLYFLDRIRPYSRKNGGCMRAVPFGVISDIASCMETASRQAAITHDSDEGRFSAMAVAGMSHFALYSYDPLSRVGEFLCDELPALYVDRWRFALRDPWPTGKQVRSYGDTSVAVTTVHAVCSHLQNFDSLEAIMRAIIINGGDTDSVAAIAWGIASARYRDEALPDFMEACLEGGNSRTGAKYLREVGGRLMEKFA